MRRSLLVLAAWAALAAPVAAQPVIPNQLTGNECWEAGQGPGGPGAYVCSFQTRSSWGYYLLAAATTGTVQLLAQQNAVIMPVQSTSGVTFNMPVAPTPTDGSIVAFCNTSNAAFATQVVTITATAPQVFATGATTTLTTLAARTCVKLIYTLSNTTWSQVQ
jgi:hypothetical protein